jgi:putative ABC transport system permease protein
VYSPAAAAALGLRTRPGALLLRFDTLPTTDQEEAARAALADAGIERSLSIERGYVSDYGLGLLALVVGAGAVTLGASGVATGLAQADARADHATLAALGAAPRLRRTLAAAQALTIAGLGTVLGIAAGFVPAMALIGAVDSVDLVLPWRLLATVLVVIPLLAASLAWLLTRSRVPLERRVA